MMKTIASIMLPCLLAITAGAGCQASVGAGSDPTYAGSPRPRPSPGPAPVQATRWVTLADRNNADSDRQFINIHGQDAFTKIRIEGSRGAPVIKQIAIEFSDDRGNAQVVKMGQRLHAGQGQTIDLNGGRRAVQRIVVYTDAQAGGSYTVLGV